MEGFRGTSTYGIEAALEQWIWNSCRGTAVMEQLSRNSCHGTALMEQLWKMEQPSDHIQVLTRPGDRH